MENVRNHINNVILLVNDAFHSQYKELGFRNVLSRSNA